VICCGEKTEAFIYVMNRIPEDANVIGSGDWKEYRRGKCDVT